MDIDGDGWNNTIEIEADTDPYNASSYPTDFDNDTILDYLDSDIDGDGWNNSIEHQLGTDLYNFSSFPSDLDGDRIPDVFDIDIDGDGWNNTIEIEVETDPYDKLSFPKDLDEDSIPDSLDNDRDGDEVPNADDAYPDDPEKWEKESEKAGEGSIGWWIMGVVGGVMVVGVIGRVVLVRRREGKGDGKEVSCEREIKGGVVDDQESVEKDGDGCSEELEKRGE